MHRNITRGDFLNGIALGVGDFMKSRSVHLHYSPAPKEISE